jgi:putative adenylate-forming enzyme
MTTVTRSAAPTELERIWALALELPDYERATRDELLAYQRERLRAVVRHAASSSSYYREVLGEAASSDFELEQLPTLPKATLMSQFDRIVTDPRLRRGELEEHLAHSDAGELFLDRYHVFSTSGTTGLRGLVVLDRAEFRTWVAACLRAMAKIGITAETRLAAIGAPSAAHITRQLFAAFIGGREGSPKLVVTTPLDEVVAGLNEYRPEVIMTYASIGGLLAEEQLQGRLHIAPRVVMVASEVLTEDIERRMDEAWRIRATNIYATTEAVYMALRWPDGDGLHVSEEHVIVEAVDEDNRPVPPGTPSYRVLLTSLVSRTQPLIRYEISDSVTMAAGPDPSGRPHARIASIDGRSDDILRLAKHGGGEIDVHPYRLREPFALRSEIVQYQVRQERERFRVRVVLRRDAPTGTPEVVRRDLARAIEEAGAVPPPIEVEPVQQIAREPGMGAKLKLVVSAA